MTKRLPPPPRATKSQRKEVYDHARLGIIANMCLTGHTGEDRRGSGHRPEHDLGGLMLQQC
ncbi:hypothetical protein KIH39_15605 [Telmatocola sphagniphila]|uniref:Uncharacterized protein n=1 Tax=Telmatocola sphagniphila TaxID=1123043 RepID=A0A8E6ETQ9_9BACT|nr:hypothetical protein [Telmatocola sphagniphila]QVL30277.1 hypothetical protein KIH39_15605 [Telmatocola sphagniphila]